MSRREDFIDAGIAYRIKHGKPMCIAGRNLADVERDFNRVMSFEEGAEYGYKYAQTHPNWISVEDEMPPFDWIEDGTWRRSLPVLIYDPTRGIFVGCYESDDLYGKTYWIYDNGKRPTKEVSGGYEWDNVTHWMPIVPPRKEDNNE